VPAQRWRVQSPPLHTQKQFADGGFSGDFDEGEDDVADLELGFAAGDDGFAIAEDGDDIGGVWDFEFAEVPADDGRFGVEAILHDFELAGVEVENLADAAVGQLGLNDAGDDRGGTDSDVHAERLHDGFVLGVFHAGNGLGDAELLFGELAGDKIVVIVIGDGDEDVGAVGAGLMRGEGRRYRRMNALNPQALKRATRRLAAFDAFARSTESQLRKLAPRSTRCAPRKKTCR